MREIYIGFFILCIVLGSHAETVLKLLRGDEENPLRLTDDGLICMDVDASLFASKINSSLLIQGKDSLCFSLSHMMRQLIAHLKRKLTATDIDDESFLSEYKKTIEEYAKHGFPKTISIKIKHVQRYLNSYIKTLDADILTSLLVTGVRSRNEGSKLAYTSTRSQADDHSELIKQFWNELELDESVSKMLGILNVFKTEVATVPKQEFTGSSKVVDAQKATEFFRTIRLNFHVYHKNDGEYFNLFSIYVRYAMSLLLGTREFLNSAHFGSYSEELRLWSMNEKSQDHASGVRLVPVCEIMQSILAEYKHLLASRGLGSMVYIFSDLQYVPFRPEEAHQALLEMSELAAEDREVLSDYVAFVPLNSGRHLFTQKAVDFSMSANYIAAYLGHYAKGEEQLGKFSTLCVTDYCNEIKKLTMIIAAEYGIKEL